MINKAILVFFIKGALVNISVGDLIKQDMFRNYNVGLDSKNFQMKIFPHISWTASPICFPL